MYIRHEFKVIAVVSVFSLLVGISLASKSPKEDETEDNSIGVMTRSARQYFSSLMPTEWDRTSLLTNIAMPALFLLFLSSMGSKASAVELNQIRRKKRSPMTDWTDRLQRLLDNFQTAVQKMQKFEEELENEINDDSVETIDLTD